MSRFLVFIAALLSLSSCSDDDDSTSETAACGVGNPVEDLGWLQAEIIDREANPTEDTKYCYIEQAELNGQTVFIYEDCNPAINKIVPVFDCEGDFIGRIGNEVQQNELSDSCVIWLPEDFACLINFSCVRNN
ncbi:hypothetical protein [Allomuricauda sp. d1]|uniref:hypothetical protein n=1 Tax=Allomuricauda sp. d1 TaxID=3136725 RepID=UPI0031DAF10C